MNRFPTGQSPARAGDKKAIDSAAVRHGRDAEDSSGSGVKRSAFDVTLNMRVPEPDPPLRGWLENELTRLAVLLGVESGVVALVVVDDVAMAQLHEKHKGVSGTTDVLTFDLADRPGVIEGDVAVCLDEAARQAAARGHDVRHEVLLYALHGLLHLLGYDDAKPSDAVAMHQREDQLLTAAGWGAVFGRNQL